MTLTLLAIAGIAIGAWLWAREWRTPPDAPAERRLLKELARHDNRDDQS